MRAGLLALGVTAAGTAMAEDLDVRVGVDYLLRRQSTVTAFQYSTVTKDIGDGFHIGQSVYSAAWGDAGGLFIGGFDAFKRFQITDTTSIDVGGFVGGGGGAIVVVGDGLMTKPQVTINQAFASGFMAHLGVGWTRVTGSPIDTPSLTFAVSRRIGTALDIGHSNARPAAGVVIASVSGMGRYYYPMSSSRRNGAGVMNPMYLVGAEFTFRDLSMDHWEFFFSAMGAGYGDGSGYAEWLAGPRYYTNPFLGGRVRGFADVGAGFAGGGDVDTGGGLMVAASAGVDVSLFRGLHVETGVMGIGAPTGDFRAASAFVRGAFRFDDPASNVTGVDGGPAHHWRFSTGLSYQFSHPGFRAPGHKFTGSDPVLVETGADLFFGDRFYVNGGGYTVVDGNSGGFAMGTVGIGLEFPLGDRVSVAGEVFGGAAAGGGINTSGGLIYGAKAELDYKVSDSFTLSGGVGKWYSLGGAQPVTLHGAVKIPFTTFHAD
ncbi:hypothetical protein STA1M1_11600 [Sinisalibacter aestuarii]|uniref:Uncharacterized protein n=2 Tax=Sinisalibacter aestuarii TaxID=2949426 RepID=A0ABQ5LSJ8_9RHOB|nr:hypothetical protein STA1M1_11600 [Sinisalibacter aestuarii]